MHYIINNRRQNVNNFGNDFSQAGKFFAENRISRIFSGLEGSSRTRSAGPMSFFQTRITSLAGC